MLYILNLIFSCLYLSHIREENGCVKFLLKASPVILLWVLIIGGQDNIGADYNNYLTYFSYPFYEVRFEPFFVELSRLCYNIGIQGQGLFFVYAAINAIVIFIASYRLGIRHWAIFFFLFVTVSTFFNNQMNGLRQCTAVSLVYWAFAELYNSKVKGTTLILFATGFHFSAIVNIIFLFFKRLTNLLTTYPRLLLVITLVVSLLPTDESINSVLFDIIPDELSEETGYEQMYDGDYEMSKGVDLVVKLSKIILIPIYWLSIGLLRDDRLTPKESLFFRFGLLSYTLRCVLLVNNLIGRFSYFFWIPSILPIYYLCVDLKNKNRRLEMIGTLLYCSVIYFYKVFAEIGEYKSSFIYFD